MRMQLLLEGSHNRGGVCDPEGVIDYYRDVGVQSVSEPARLYVDDLLNARNVFGGVMDLLADMRIDAIQASRNDRLGRLPDDSKYRKRDEKTNNGVGKRKARPDTRRSEYDSQARESIRSGVIAVGDECCAVHGLADANTEHSDGFVADETDDTRNGDGSELRDRLRMDQAIDGLIAGYQR
jgi:hypothetical protein